MTPPPPAPTPGRAAARSPRAPSLERRLPLLITAALVGILAVSLAITHAAIVRQAEAATRQRLRSAAALIAPTVARASVERAAALRAAVRGPDVRALLALPEWADSLRRAPLERTVRARVDSVLPGPRVGLRVVLRDAAFRERVVWGPPLGVAERLAFDDAAWAGLARGDTAIFSPMYASDGVIVFWIAVPIRDGGRLVGSLAAQRVVTGGRDDRRLMQGLLGDDVSLYLRNARAPAFWSQAPGQVASPPRRQDTTALGARTERPEVGWGVLEEAAALPTPYVVALEVPLRAMLAPARRTTLVLAALGALLALAGAALALAIGRRLTGPLVALTEAAERLARGEPASLVRTTSDDELGRLARSFHAMAGEITQSRAELERRMAVAIEAREEAERANRAKADFLAVMSHELRTPLNAIGGYAQLIEMGVYGPTTAEQRDALARLTRSQSHLLRLIEDVLSFAKIDAGQVAFALTAVPLEDALADVESLLAPQVRARGIALHRLSCEPGLAAHADPERLRQVVLNLVTNAVKFTPTGGAVTLACESDARTVRVLVRDTGPGIAPDQRDRIFEPFVQGDRALSRPADGVGLGLSISRDLARGMGGDVTVESTSGAGSTFALALPRHPAAGAAPGGVLPAPGATARASASR